MLIPPTTFKEYIRHNVCLWHVNEKKAFGFRFHVCRISQRAMTEHLNLSYMAVNVNISDLF